jgi:site-specific recombinase XerD
LVSLFDHLVGAREQPLRKLKTANQGVDTRSLQHYLGHKNIQHTVRYSELSPERFRDFWKD